jgi:hypothetical protein
MSEKCAGVEQAGVGRKLVQSAPCPPHRAYARALAEFGPEPVHSSDIANAMGLSLSQAEPIRDELIKKGMAYSPERGLIGFTAPKFDEFMRRANEGSTPRGESVDGLAPLRRFAT